VELMLRATSALERARANPAGAWLQEFEDRSPLSPS